MICLYNIENMLRKTIMTLVCVGCCVAASAQTGLESLKEKYEANKRDIEVVKEYVEALEKAKKGKEAERVTKEYMYRCPVLQVEDKDTYLLLNKYVFADPYSNVFEYGIYAMKKMKWDREDIPAGEDKATRLERLFRSLGSGVSGDNEIDKRYEVLMMLSRNLNKEIDKQCEPYLQDKQYVLPLYDSLKLERLTYLVNKGQLLGQDAMRLKLAVNKALHAGNYARVVRDLEVAANLNMTDLRDNYIVAILTVLSESTLDKELINNILSFVLRLRDRKSVV